MKGRDFVVPKLPPPVSFSETSRRAIVEFRTPPCCPTLTRFLALSYHETECANEQQLVDLLKGVSVHNVTAGSSHSTPDPNCRFVYALFSVFYSLG